MSVLAGLIESARSDPDRVAIEQGNDGWTRGEFLAAAMTVRVGPLAGVEPGTTVALLAGNSPVFLAGFLGIALAGGVAAVLDPSWTDERRRDALTQLQPFAVLAEEAGDAR